jgi:phage tail-like protein
MAEFPTNPQRFNPYDDLTFRVKWDGFYIPGITRVTGLLRTTEVIENREGGNLTVDHKGTGRTKYEPITLERGLTDDPAFESWANLVFNLQGNLGSEASLNELRKTVFVDLYNEAGQLVRTYNIFRCWPSSYQAVSAFDANNPGVLTESITLQNEGWARDTTVIPPPQN